MKLIGGYTMSISSVAMKRILGGRKAFGGGAGSTAALIAEARKGLPYASLLSLTKTLDVSRQQLLLWLALPERTIARRPAQQRLRADESDRVMRAARLTAIAEDVFGKMDGASRWLRTPNRSLGGETPLAMLDTDLGARQVEDALGRIAHGVFA